MAVYSPSVHTLGSIPRTARLAQLAECEVKKKKDSLLGKAL